MKKLLSCLLAASASVCLAQTPADTTSPAVAKPPTSSYVSQHLMPGSKIFISPMDGFETYLSAAMIKKQVPVVVVDSPEKADFIVTGNAHVEKAGWAKTIFISGASSAAASITVKDAHDGSLAYAYSVDKYNSARQSQSTAEACAKHMKEFIGKNSKK